jgi:hypothetical protein
MAKNPPDETFSTRDIAEGLAHELLLLAEGTVDAARKLPAGDPGQVALMRDAAAALAAATPFVGLRGPGGARTRRVAA